jgi:hypothetical protein
MPMTWTPVPRLRWLPVPLFLSGCILIAAPDRLAGQSAPAGSDAAATRVPRVLVSATRTGEVRIDGRIDEPAWQAAPVASGFMQSQPDEGVPATHDTEVRLLFDDQAMYVAARMWDEPDSIEAGLTRRDEAGMTKDWFGIWIDPNYDRRTGYAFLTTAAGVQQDRTLYDDQIFDATWDAVWESAVTIDSLGWSAEMRIPLSQIHYSARDDAQTWGVNFTRRRVATNERSDFAPQTRRRQFAVSQFATLEQLRISSSPRHFEVRPYVLSTHHNGQAQEGDPFFDGNATVARAGADLRVGVGSAFTLNATANPDFGQVEADPAVINLTAFESFFQERRPFFVDDAQIFGFGLSGGQNQLFYSRRIGRSPRVGAPAGAAFVDVPEAATILGAAKFTGRTQSGLGVGALAAVTDDETGTAAFVPSRGLVTFRAEPRTEYGVVAAQQDFKRGDSYVRGVVTGLRRDLPSDGAFDFLPAHALGAGLRFEHQWHERDWRFSGFFAASHVRGRAPALIAVQRASNHYFQRPDATRFRVDSSATSMTGAEWRLQLERTNALHWTGTAWVGEITQGLEVNDLGFSGSGERLDGGVRLAYRELRPGKIFRDYGFSAGASSNFSHEAFDRMGSWSSWREAYTAGSFTLGSQVTLLNYKGGSVNLGWQPDLYSRSATRGGPVMIQPGNRSFAVSVNSDRRDEVNVSAGFSTYRVSRDAGRGTSFDVSLNLRPTTAIVLELQPSFSTQSEGSQYVASTPVLPYEPTFGRRYLFGELERKTVVLETRLDYSLSPHLTLQIYAQPLLSSGDYVRYKQLAASRSYEFRTFTEGPASPGGAPTCSGGTICRDASGTQRVDFDGDGSIDYTFPDRDFNTRSFVGNAVLRWEYRPGSTIFLVWQRQQRGDTRNGDFQFGRDFDALWAAPADNRFVVKVNYWLGL